MIKKMLVAVALLNGSLFSIGSQASDGKVNFTGNITTFGCRISNRDIKVPLGSVKPSQFSGPGSTSNMSEFYIFIGCDPGTRLSMVIDATPDSSGVPGVMAIDSTVTNPAEGVGIELRRFDGTPVIFGSSMYLDTFTGGLVGIGPGFRAYYYQTKPTVLPGIANATATFTLIYD